jgi:NAD(P)H dehydrogenase (quinone)
MGLLTGKKGLIINTQGTPSEYYDSSGMTEAMKKTSDTGILGFCGIESIGHIFFGAVPSVDDTTRKGMLEKLKTQLNEIDEKLLARV